VGTGPELNTIPYRYCRWLWLLLVISCVAHATSANKQDFWPNSPKVNGTAV